MFFRVNIESVIHDFLLEISRFTPINAFLHKKNVGGGGTLDLKTLYRPTVFMLLNISMYYL